MQERYIHDFICFNVWLAVQQRIWSVLPSSCSSIRLITQPTGAISKEGALKSSKRVWEIRKICAAGAIFCWSAVENTFFECKRTQSKMANHLPLGTLYHLVPSQGDPPPLECDHLVPLYHLGTTPDHPPTPGYKLAYVPPLGTLTPPLHFQLKSATD